MSADSNLNPCIKMHHWI